MPNYPSDFTGKQIDSVIAKGLLALSTNDLEDGTFNFATDVAISNVIYHTLWKKDPAAVSNIYGVAVHPSNGKLYQIYKDADGNYSATAYDALPNYTQAYPTASTDTAGRWNVTIPSITDLFDGLTIKIFLSKSYNGTYNTLNLNGLGDKLVWFRYNSRLTSHYAQYSILSLTYKASGAGSYAIPSTPVTDLTGKGTITDGWIIENIYDINDTSTLYQYNFKPKVAAGNTLYRYMLCFSNLNKELVPATLVSNSTATTKTLNSTLFDPFGFITYYNSTTTIAAGAEITATSAFQVSNNGLNLSYSFNVSGLLTVSKPVYAVAEIADAASAKLVGTSQDFPTTADGKIYIYLGMAYSPSCIALSMNHPVYIFDASLGVVPYLPAASALGNRSAGSVVTASADGTLQTEKLAISSDSTTKAHMEYNSTDDCIDFIFD